MQSFSVTTYLGFLRNIIMAALPILPMLVSAAEIVVPLDVNPVWGQGITLPGNRIGYSSPKIAEVDGNSANGMEVVVASTNGQITAVRADGSILWTVTTPDSGCGGPSPVYSSPAVGALYGDGIPYVVIGYGGFGKLCDGGILAIRGTDGTIVWQFSTKAYSKKVGFWAVLHAVYSSPAIADTNGDGRMEIGFGSFDRNVYLLNFNGKVRWYYTAADTVWSSPTFADLNGDGRPEMLIGTDISQNKFINPPTKNGGNLYAFRTKKFRNRRYGFRDSRAFLWMTPLEQVLFSTPRTGDVLPENPGLEVVINSGCYFPEETKQKVGRWSRVFSGQTGTLLRTLPLEACSSSSPALADVNGDGALDVLVTVNGAGAVGGDGNSRLKAFDARNNQLLWSIVPTFAGRNYGYGGNFISPVVADLNNDGKLEVLTSVGVGVGVYDAETGELVNDSMATRDVLLNTPAVGDIDNDGLIDIVASGKAPGGGAGIYRWEVGSPYPQT